MNRDELIAEIKKQLQEEIKYHISSLENKIPDEQKQQLKKAKDSTSSFIQENPWASVALAALAGYVLARLIYKQGDDR